MHKLATKIARGLRESNSGAIMEGLKGVKYRVLNTSKMQNRNFSKWDAKTFQFMLEYKLKWLKLPVKYVNLKNSSRTCPPCSGSTASYEGRLTKCNLILDRDIVAVLNLQMWGHGFAPKAFDELIKRGLSRGNKSPLIST